MKYLDGSWEHLQLDYAQVKKRNTNCCSLCNRQAENRQQRPFKKKKKKK